MNVDLNAEEIELLMDGLGWYLNESCGQPEADANAIALSEKLGQALKKRQYLQGEWSGK